ncbi:hypothetical protein Tsubulata_032238 [Turnera subulata]|uniref:Uncharacterized protein n=1 Tax=Turnera subulata TaxID=218843 RepID=A0A9Q0JPM3_9ROSI|nr:hypothetical protein Tsubulata_032238 [Turnera subulata]
MMMAKEATTMILFPLLLLCVCVPIVVSVEPEVDFHYLVASWPPSFCNNTESKARKVCFLPNLGFRYEEFSIHGMWPQKGGVSLIGCANEENFDDNKLAPMKTTLNKLWPSFKVRIEVLFRDFWKEEWDKHGKCSGLKLEKYFQVAIDRFQEQDLEKILRTAGIRPNAKVTVKLSKIAAAFTSKGVIPVIHCNDLFYWFRFVDKLHMETHLRLPRF